MIIIKRSVVQCSMLRLTIFSVALLFPLVGYTALTENLAISTVAMSMGNAVTADPPGITGSVHFNPAGLTRLKSRQIELNTVAALFSIQAEFDAPPDYNIFGLTDDPILFDNKSQSDGSLLYIPHYGPIKLPGLLAPLASFSINPPGSKFTFANALYAPQAVGFSRPDDDAGRYQGKQVALQRITYLSPTVAYQFNDAWSLGVGIQLSHQAMVVNTDFRAPNELLGVIDIFQEALCGFGGQILEAFINVCGGDVGPFDDIANLDLQMTESISPTFNVGVLWEPTDWFAWGAVYNHEHKMKLEGEFVFDYDEEFAQFFQGFNASLLGAILGQALGLPDGVSEERGNVSLDLTYPAHFQTGIKVKPIPSLQINFDLMWTDYDEWDAFTIKFDRPIEVLSVARLLSPDLVTPTSLSLPRNYESVWNWGVGVQYNINPRLVVRAGYEQRTSSIPGDYADSMVPLGDADLFGVGVGYRWDKDSYVDFSLSYLVSSQEIEANSSCVINCTGFGNVIYNPYAGYNVENKVSAWIAGFSFRTTF